MRGHAKRALELRRRLCELLEYGTASDRASLTIDRFLILLIIINLVAVILESVPALAQSYRPLFRFVELFSLAVFSTEYFLRIWVAPDHALYRKLSPMQARCRKTCASSSCSGSCASSSSRAIRPACVRSATRPARLPFSAALMHLAERHVQPDKLGTLPDAIWWAFVTLGTIGYGDVVPVTVLGKMIGSVTILAAIVMIALPVGIIATAFAEEIHRRDFVVTWGMVARVPLFAELDAAEIAGIMRLLRAQVVEPGSIVVRRGEPAHSMYFIARGAVDIDLKNRRVTLGPGHFFGEIAVLRRSRRSATVTALTRVNLLMLDGGDLHGLMERNPHIADSVHAVVRERIGADIFSRKGDMVAEELAQGTEQPPE